MSIESKITRALHVTKFERTLVMLKHKTFVSPSKGIFVSCKTIS